MVYKKVVSVILVVFSLVSSVSVAEAAKRRTPVKKVTAPTQTSLIVDGHSGKILHESNAREKIYPASLTKVMTLYLVFEALDSGKMTLNHKMYVSKYATEARPSKLYLKQKERIAVEDVILALTVKSANDAARVAAENIAGSEQKFARLMTIRAKQLGMNDTNFVNASGWHDPRNVSTAVDLAKLSIAIKRDFPQYYHYFNRTNFVYKGKTIYGHNRVTATYPGAEGLKTGYHVPAGYNLITIATRGDKSLVGVVTGGKNSATRDRNMVQLLDQHFGVPQKNAIKARTRMASAVKKAPVKVRGVHKRKVASIKSSKNTRKRNVSMNNTKKATSSKS
jgi:D-alanyl-D-alanine carboxypeptidase (penicillin-binding protein 5/6)